MVHVHQSDVTNLNSSVCYWSNAHGEGQQESSTKSAVIREVAITLRIVAPTEVSTVRIPIEALQLVSIYHSPRRCCHRWDKFGVSS